MSADEAISRRFVGEPMTPAAGSSDARAMGRGEPGLPARFIWRNRRYRTTALLEKWKTSGPCRTGCGEMYLRRHWYRIAAEPDEPYEHAPAPLVLTVYCDRQACRGQNPKARWWVYSASTDPDSGGAGE